MNIADLQRQLDENELRTLREENETLRKQLQEHQKLSKKDERQQQIEDLKKQFASQRVGF